ncbi:MAG: hypothetical protein QNJ48_11070 [Desulfobacterales bacterium]|nr:hypothetical protein [Desulfobacterales bacterium]MDJ0884696.1 hypothetical protein [Desulfobacterales bacterium]
MELSLPEMIQIYRRRAGMNQGTLGAAAFDTSFESGRTKIKNLELGRQKPTLRDLENMARVLKLPLSALAANTADGIRGQAAASSAGLTISERTTQRFPGLDAYLEMLNKAVFLEDEELIAYISEKLSRLFAASAPNDAQISEAAS